MAEAIVITDPTGVASQDAEECIVCDLPVVGKIHFHVVYATEIFYFVQFLGEGLEGGQFIRGRLLKTTNLEAVVLYHERLILNETDRGSLNQTMFMSQVKLGNILM